jgi:ribonuclease T1
VGIKPNSWKQVIVYLAILAAAYLVFSLASGNNAFINCTPPAPVIEQGVPAATENHSDIPTGAKVINVADLPPEGRTALGLIKSGGPFPYSRDGTVFSNYEGLLPAKPGGYYHEYTVITPGSNDRGARRIVAGSNGEYYYTNDHYGSFKLIQE